MRAFHRARNEGSGNSLFFPAAFSFPLFFRLALAKTRRIELRVYLSVPSFPPFEKSDALLLAGDSIAKTIRLRSFNSSSDRTITIDIYPPPNRGDLYRGSLSSLNGNRSCCECALLAMATFLRPHTTCKFRPRCSLASRPSWL